ncbi:MAG: hypothetical protein ACYCYI_10400 [Saccharofermentanales bacterium]
MNFQIIKRAAAFAIFIIASAAAPSPFLQIRAERLRNRKWSAL